ncbi:MAG: TRAP transporter small permease [Synergistaceae bacterium]|jgi:TRAP-type C4-dicarboxylate transport system permease small subunit|nr:TRAP transporter small permease [Synergistaceae bacterium]
MRYLRWVWYHLEEIFLVPSLITSVTLIFVQVIMRYVIGSSLSWSEELARYLFVWQIWIGVSYSARNKSHLRITMLRDRFGPRGRLAVELAVTAVWICFAIFIAARGFDLVAQVARYKQKSSALGMPMMYAHLAVPTGCVLMTARLVENTVRDLLYRAKRGGLSA